MGANIRKRTATLISRVDMVAAVVGLVAVFFITVVALVVVVVAPLSSSNEDIAIGDVFAAGIFMLALVAAVVAVMGLLRASRKPMLETSWSWLDMRDGSCIDEKAFPRDPSPRHFTGPVPHPAVNPRDLVPLAPAVFRVTVANHGTVAAKNVAVLLRLEGIYFSPAPEFEPGCRWSLCPADEGSRIQWDGGIDRPVYPGQIPRRPEIQLMGMWALPEIAHTDWGQVVTFADALPKPGSNRLAIDARPSPPSDTAAERSSILAEH